MQLSHALGPTLPRLSRPHGSRPVQGRGYVAMSPAPTLTATHPCRSTLRATNPQRMPIHTQPNWIHLSTAAPGQGSARGSWITYGCNSISSVCCSALNTTSGKLGRKTAAVPGGGHSTPSLPGVPGGVGQGRAHRVTQEAQRTPTHTLGPLPPASLTQNLPTRTELITHHNHSTNTTVLVLLPTCEALTVQN